MDTETQLWLSLVVNAAQLIYNFFLTARNLDMYRMMRDMMERSPKPLQDTKRTGEILGIRSAPRSEKH